MRTPMYVAMNQKQYDAKNEIIRIERMMKVESDPEKLFDLFCEADDIWAENFEVLEVMANVPFTPDHERIFLKRKEVIEKAANIRAALNI